MYEFPSELPSEPPFLGTAGTSEYVVDPVYINGIVLIHFNPSSHKFLHQVSVARTPGLHCPLVLLPQGLSGEGGSVDDDSEYSDDDEYEELAREILRPAHYIFIQTHSYTALDEQILNIRTHFPVAGVPLLHGSLKSRGYHIPRRRISESLMRIDPARLEFLRGDYTAPQILCARPKLTPAP